MENQKEISIDEHTKGVLVLAKHELVDSEWLILVYNADNYNLDGKSFRIFSHMCYCLDNGVDYIYEETPGWWGDSPGYRFYEPTKKQKRTAIDVLRRHNLKFVSVLNKLVRIK